jgi:hypothetical protein
MISFKKIFPAVLCLFSSVAFTQQYRSQIFAPDVSTLQTHLLGDELSDPVIRRGTEDQVQISFDQMSHVPQYYAYSIELCNADWTPSGLMEIEYLEGFNINNIEDSDISFNTTFDYTHYSFVIPNENVMPLVSGNYVIKVFDREDPDVLVLTTCFSIEENLVTIRGNVSGSTVYGVNTHYQQVNFEIDCSENPIANPTEELKVVVRQNGRWDNQVFDVKPTYIQPMNFIYRDNRNLIFEGGNEFYRIDFSHIRNYSGQIGRISFHKPYYNVETTPGKQRTYDDYQYDLDVNGRFKVHGQDIWGDMEIDYSIVHFAFPKEEPWLDGSVYVAGYFNNNLLNNNNKMTYNFERKQYELSVVLKNGGYNYQFLFLPVGQKAGSSILTDGSYWQTRNEYKVYVYYRPYGARYDRLIGVQQINN